MRLAIVFSVLFILIPLYSCDCLGNCNACNPDKSAQCSTCYPGYYLDSSAHTCPYCHSPCITCLGSATSCTTCVDSANQSPSVCACHTAGTTMDDDYRCRICHKGCATCTTFRYCLTCQDSDGYFFEGNLCPECFGPCRTCTGTKTNCLTCWDPTNQLPPPSCQCQDNYHYLGYSHCYLCVSPCLTCTSSSDCLSCVSNAYLLQGNRCPACTLPCATCSGTLTNCITCIDVPNQAAPTCNCTSTTRYLNPSSKYCDLCISPCLTCSSSTDCLSCVSTAYHLVGTSCPLCTRPCMTCQTSLTDCITCQDVPNQAPPSCGCTSTTRYFNNSTKNCDLCISPCLTCSSATACLSCVSTSYFLVGTNCELCTRPCMTCLTSLTDCITCQDVPNQSPPTCGCTSTTRYLNLSTHNCDPCISPCATCTTATDCLSCSLPHHVLVNNRCVCEDGYIPTDNLEINCIPCQYPCKGCKKSITQCTSCVKSFYYQKDQCFQCNPQCKSCITTSDYCLECSDLNHAFYGNDCFCRQGYYTGLSQKCEECQSPCSTCVINYNHCTSCDSNLYDIVKNKCICIDGYYLLIDHCEQCKSICTKCKTLEICTECIDGYYLYIDKCHKCGFKCATCVTESTHCLTCAFGFFMTNEGKCSECISYCKTCLDAYTCEICFDGAYRQDNYCIPCLESCKTCVTQYEHCLTCKQHAQLIDNSCYCIKGYYEEKYSCMKCVYPCIECQNENICIACDSISNLIMTEHNQCICEDHYYWLDNRCQICDNLCLTCITIGSNCLSCDNTLFRVLNYNQCVCKDKYYEDGFQKCQSCKSDGAKIVQKCQYKDSTDGIWTYGEECDDGNDVLRDGCSNSKLDKGYSCISIILQTSICFKCPDNCSKCELKDDNSIYCNNCLPGYFFNKLKCIQCSLKCINCVDNVSNCIGCRFTRDPLSNQCQYCEYKDGYYSNFKTYTCNSICGDFYLADNEECDDGNQIDGDGCNSECKNEINYACKDTICIHQPPPIPKIIEYGQFSTFKSKRQVKLSYNVKLKISNNFNLANIIKLSVQEGGELTSSFDSPYDVIQDVTFDEQQFANFSAIISLDLKKSGENQLFVLEFSDTSSIISYEGQPQQITKITAKITDYHLISYQTQQQVEIINSQNQKALILFATLAAIALILGGIDIFYSLLDTLQLLSYLTYLNIDMPYNLQDFFQLFSVAQLSSFAQNEKVQEIIHQLIKWSSLWDISNEMSASEYSTLFIINGAMIILCWITLMVGYIVAKILIKSINVNKPLLSSYIGYPDIFSRVKIYYITVKIWFFEICFNAVQECFYSGIIRSQISTSFDISFAIIIQFISYSKQSDAMLVKLSQYLAIVSCIFYFLSIYLTLFIVDLPNYVQKMKRSRQKYGAVLEGIKEKQFSKYFNSFHLVKKFFFMVLLICCYPCALFQVISITLLQITESFCLLCFRPLIESKEQFKQSISEVSQSLNLIFLSILAIDSEIHYLTYEGRLNMGWLCITFISMMLITQLICDFLQQWARYVKKYRLLKNFLSKLEKKIKGERDISHVNPFLFEQMTLQIL